MFINAIYVTTGLTQAITTKNFVYYFCTEKKKNDLYWKNDLYIKFTYSSCWCINFPFISFFLFVLCYNVAGQAAQLPCHQLQLGSHPLGFYSCIFNFQIAFCFNLSSFSCKSFSFFSNSLFLSSVSMAARQLRTSNSSSGDSCKND